MNTTTLKKNQNYNLINLDGTFLSKIDKKRFEWYQKKDLVTLENDRTIRFKKLINFSKKRHPYYLIDRPSHCFVCGETENLTKHHVVPYCFRKYFKDEFKNRSSYDIFIICHDCHHGYERIAEKIKNGLLRTVGKRYSIELNNIKELHRALGYIETIDILDIPVHRRLEMLDKIQDFCSKFNIEYFPFSTLHDRISNNLKELKSNKLSWCKFIVDKNDTKEIILFWRKHFIETMQPKFLPKEWEIDFIPEDPDLR